MGIEGYLEELPLGLAPKLKLEGEGAGLLAFCLPEFGDLEGVKG